MIAYDMCEGCLKLSKWKAYHEAGHAVMALEMGVRLGEPGTATGGVGLTLVPNKTDKTTIGTLEYHSDGHTNLYTVTLATLLSELPQSWIECCSQEQLGRFYKEEAERFAIISLAGEAAERLFSPRSFEKGHLAADYVKVNNYLGKFFLDEGAKERRIAELKQIVHNFVVIRWPIITEVAKPTWLFAKGRQRD